MEAISVAPQLEIYPARSVVLSPLSFGCVNGGHPVTSQTLLFRLPIELVQEVVTYLDTADFQSLALVDRDCRQLARSRLFTSVALEYSDEKWTLLDKLSHEARSRRDNGGITSSPSIGACIRRVTVAKRSRGMNSRHRMLSPTDSSISREERDAMHNAECNYCGIYLPGIAEALRFSLPNLDEFVWMDRIEFPQYMLMAIASSPIRHLGMRDVQPSLDCEYQLPPPRQQRWALRSLDLGTVVQPFHDWRDRDVNKFCLTILEVAAPTLEKLSWRDYRGTKLSFGSSAIRFPRLRTLSLDAFSMPDDTVLDAFFPSGTENCVLRSLSIEVPSWSDRNSLAQCRRIEGLESLRLHAISDRGPKPADAVFLSANPQLKSLTLCRYTPEQLTTRLRPLLASNFKFLTTLVVHFTPPMVNTPDSPLTAIGQLLSLTSLWIVASKHHQWATGVHQTITALSPLRNLTLLALYREHTAVVYPGHKLRTRYKEMWRNNIVELYVKALRGLRWVYFGQLVYKVVGNVVVREEEGGMRRDSPEEVWDSPDWR